MRLVHYDVILEVLTPLHIGTGQEWYPDADFVEEGPDRERFVRLVDVDAALLEMTDQEIASIREGRIAAAIGERGRERHTIARLPVRGPGNVTRTRAMQRLADGRPYIPGTTVKGSIRTALLQALVRPDALGRLPEPGTREKTAAAPIEQRTFGVALDAAGSRQVQFANRDLNRAVRVSDFLPEGRAPVAVVNMSAHRLGGAPRREGVTPIPIWCEAIEPGARFKGVVTLELDSPVWRAMTGGQRDAVERLFATWHQAGRRLLEAEEQAWSTGPSAVREGVLAFLQKRIEANEVCVNLGWGGGWRSKTLGTLIPKDRLPEIATTYGLRRWTGRDFPDRFPVTRKVAYARGEPLPPGWVRVLRRRRDQESGT
jgi:CRISPR type III-A-associated RAMP protein Csm5